MICSRPTFKHWTALQSSLPSFYLLNPYLSLGQVGCSWWLFRCKIAPLLRWSYHRNWRWPWHQWVWWRSWGTPSFFLFFSWKYFLLLTLYEWSPEAGPSVTWRNIIKTSIFSRFQQGRPDSYNIKIIKINNRKPSLAAFISLLCFNFNLVDLLFAPASPSCFPS